MAVDTDHPHHHLPAMPDDIDTVKPTPSSYPDRAAYGRAAYTRHTIAAAIFTIILLAAIAALIVWLVYRPDKPHFTVLAATVTAFNSTALPLPPLVAANMQFTVLTRNPNRRTGLYYDRLTTAVYYRNQAITPLADLPPLYHRRRSAVEIAVVVGGGVVPATEEVVNGVRDDVAYGVMGLRLVLMGRVKYRAGAIRSGHHGLHVKCDMLMGLKNGYSGPVPLLGNPACNVDI